MEKYSKCSKFKKCIILQKGPTGSTGGNWNNNFIEASGTLMITRIV